MPEICFLSATELVGLVRAKELSVREVMEAHLAQIERLNGQVNAIVTLTAERALDRARAADDALARGEEVGPLAGLPVAHKDLFSTGGVRTTFGSLVYRDFVPDQDALIVERYGPADRGGQCARPCDAALNVICIRRGGGLRVDGRRQGRYDKA